MRNFHVPLPESLHQDLKHYATQTSRPATELAREAISLFLKAERRKQRAQAIAEFAQQHADTALDLDEDLEQAGLEVWSAEE